MLQLLFWTSLLLLVWTYAGYPLAMLALARLRPVQVAAGGGAGAPKVSVVVAVRNGAADMEARVANLFEQAYPTDRLEVVLALNGCRDGSGEKAAALAASDARIRVVESAEYEGKAGALNLGVAAATGEVIVFADTRQRFEPDVVRLLADAVMAPGIGAATGRLVIGETNGGAVRGMGRYWSVETLLREAEGRTGSVIGATGAIYAVRRDAYREIPAGTLLDDVYLPLRVALDGGRVVMEPRAVAHDRPTPRQGREYRRRVRTLLGNLELVRLLPSLLVPSNPLFVRFVSHKLLRVVSPVMLLVLLATGLSLGGAFYGGVALGEAAVLTAGALGLLLPIGPLSVPAAFVLVQAAAIEAMLRHRRGTSGVWV